MTASEAGMPDVAAAYSPAAGYSPDAAYSQPAGSSPPAPNPTPAGPTNPPTAVAPRSGSAGLPSGGAWLRLLLGLAAAAALWVSWIPDKPVAFKWLQLAVMAVLVLWAMARPGSAAALLIIGGGIGIRIFFGHAVLDGSLIALVVLLPLVHQLAAVAAVVPVRSTLAGQSLLPSALRLVGAVLATVLVMLLAAVTGLAPFRT